MAKKKTSRTQRSNSGLVNMERVAALEVAFRAASAALSILPLRDQLICANAVVRRALENLEVEPDAERGM